MQHVSVILRRLRRRASRSIGHLAAHLLTARFALTARFTRTRLTNPSAPVVVSLTTYGARLHSVHVTIESIARGSELPGRIVLWLDPDVDLGALPPSIRRLTERGLEVARSPWAIGPHKKYLPAVSGVMPPHEPLVTADDDVLYPRSWLRDLLAAAADTPDTVVAHRVRDVALDASGDIAPYASWPLSTTDTAAPRRFPTGASGVLYPVSVQLRLRELGRAFEACCPRADDLWLHHTTLTSGVLARQIRPRARTFLEIPGTQTQALHRENTAQNGNDVQVAQTYSTGAIAMLRAGAAADRGAMS